MLYANEFTAGTLADAEPTSLLLPSGPYGKTFLIGLIEETPVAVFLDGDHIFRSFKCATSSNWNGILISSIRIDVDETSASGASLYDIPFGSIIRASDYIGIVAMSDNFLHDQIVVILEKGLPQAPDLSVSFSKWRILVGDAQDRRVLKSIDVTPTPSP